jgi:hypothetical protein
VLDSWTRATVYVLAAVQRAGDASPAQMPRTSRRRRVTTAKHRRDVTATALHGAMTTATTVSVHLAHSAVVLLVLVLLLRRPPHATV